jgi:hypothetical protein
MELKNMKQKDTKRGEIYYEKIQKLVHGLQVPTIDSFLIIVFRTGLQSYLKIANARMKQSTLQQHKEVAMLCEKSMTITKIRNALLVEQNIKQAIPTKHKVI